MALHCVQLLNPRSLQSSYECGPHDSVETQHDYQGLSWPDSCLILPVLATTSHPSLSPPSMTLCFCPSHNCGSPDTSCCLTNIAPLVWNTLSTLHSLNTTIIQSSAQKISSLKWDPFSSPPSIRTTFVPLHYVLCKHLSSYICALTSVQDFLLLDPRTYYL